MITLAGIASRFVGLKEVPGSNDDPMIMEMLQLDNAWPKDDETPWCSAFVNYVCWLGGVERTKKLNARSWLEVGRSITLDEAEAGFDVVILSRPPSKENGHVGFFMGTHIDDKGNKSVLLLGGNQGDAVNIKPFPLDRVIGVRRLSA